ncbi:hypothetical protein Y032_0117g632 [Ancylostoma ceylanicum]|uniref:Serine/threonine-protein phosphatase n=1 Tax=Ancylostoma ceylanicum TaxID=53326 RepID=A0A016TBS0_9BILA|nr:hypothetical protein Y032_0117g632 [Ancylostoma ceylanicum]
MQSLKYKSFVPKTYMPTLLDRMIRRITREGHLSGFTDEQVLSVLRDAKASLEPQPAMLEIEAPVVIFGDIHGQLRDLLRFFSIVGPPPQNKILFLGDYVDRCKKSFEVIMLLLCYRIKYPQLIHLLRGNHECSKMNRLYGFYEELRRKRNVYMWKKFQEVFNEMPLCAVVSNRLFCMHGGISPEIHNWDSLHNLQLKAAPREIFMPEILKDSNTLRRRGNSAIFCKRAEVKPKTPRACDDGIAVDLMWSDPSMDSCTGFQFNATRATSYIFGGDTIANICQLLDIALVVRAHEVVKGGHQFMFDRKLVTIFSAPNYCGTDGNAASVMKVSRKMELSFVTLKPRMDTTRLTEEKRLLLEKMTIESAAKSPDPCARPLSTAADNKKKAIVNDDCLIGPVDIFGTDTQTKVKSRPDNGGQPKSEVVLLANGPSKTPQTKEKPQFLTSDVYESPAMNIPVAPEPKPKSTVESAERKVGEPKDTMASVTQLDPGPKNAPKPHGPTIPNFFSPKKREPTTVPMPPSPQGARESPKRVNLSAANASNSKNGALSGNDRNAASGTTTRVTKVINVPESTTSPTNSWNKSTTQLQREPPTPRMTNPTRPLLIPPPTKRYDSPISPLRYSPTSKTNQHDSPSNVSLKSQNTFISPSTARLNSIESDSSSLSTTSDRFTTTARPPSPATARLSSPTKVRSVGEATKVAIAATKVPHHPSSKNPKEIINATEKALRPPLSAPRK